ERDDEQTHLKWTSTHRPSYFCEVYW
ncbi:MAG: hypothetical protein JWO80_2768, partial [Bryobacterales bacterium]|nr:hypothetical protein [Bryobacterales bacterium]